MIRAEFTRAEDSLRLRINGHADRDGQDSQIVCAAVSGIFYALCGYLKNVKNKGLIINSIAPGRGDVICSFSGEEAMKLTCIGLLQIMMSYPYHITVKNSAFDCWECDQNCP